MGLPAASVPFRTNAGQMELLVCQEARAARRHVAANICPLTIRALRAKTPSSSENWELLQQSLFAGGLRVCPTSGTPVANLECCSDELRKALWAGLVSIATAVTDKTLTDFNRTMSTLSLLVQRHAAAPP